MNFLKTMGLKIWVGGSMTYGDLHNTTYRLYNYTLLSLQTGGCNYKPGTDFIPFNTLHYMTWRDEREIVNNNNYLAYQPTLHWLAETDNMRREEGGEGCVQCCNSVWLITGRAWSVRIRPVRETHQSPVQAKSSLLHSMPMFDLWNFSASPLMP